MEFGPRALGARSILGDPRGDHAAAMNLKIKFRESFRPFAPAVLRENAADWFAPRRGQPLHAAGRVRRSVPDRHPQDGRTMSTALSASTAQHRALHVPAVTHVDYTARVQTVDEDRNPLYYRLHEPLLRN